MKNRSECPGLHTISEGFFFFFSEQGSFSEINQRSFMGSPSQGEAGLTSLQRPPHLSFKSEDTGERMTFFEEVNI